MDHTAPAKKEVFHSETSIFAHENSMPKANQLTLPTWALLGILIVAFFILKTFIYISDKKRNGR